MSARRLLFFPLIVTMAISPQPTPAAAANELAARRGPAFSCFPLVRKALDVPIPEDLELTSRFAEAFREFRHGFLESPGVVDLDPRSQAVCRSDAEKATRQLLGIVKSRLIALLRSKKDVDRFDRFYDELLVFLRPWTEKERDRLMLDPLFDEVHVAYAKLLYAQLEREIAAGPGQAHWLPYLDPRVEFEGWDDEWSRDLGGLEPAAVDMKNRRIAVRAHTHDPATMKVLLFHELAHLQDPDLPQLLADTSERTSPSSRPSSVERRYRNELFAWERTLEFVRDRESAGIPVPGHIKNHVMPMRKLFGPEEWVRGIIRGRGM